MSTSPPSKRTKASEDDAIPKNEEQEIDQTSSLLEWRRRFPAGYRFNPLDNELIDCYLQKKIKNEPIMPDGIIQDVNIYRHNPQHLAEQYQALGDDVWYFFSPRDRKYRNGKRPKRAAGEGYWKATGADKPIVHQGVVLGKKKALVFYLGKPPNGNKTDWIMQEYTVDTPPRIKKDEHDMRLDDWVLCKIYKKAPPKPKKGGQLEEQPNASMEEEEEEELEEVTEGPNYDDQLIVEKNYDHNNMSSGYINIPPPSRLSALPQVFQLPGFSDYAAAFYHHQQQQQQQVVNYRVQQQQQQQQQQVVNYRVQQQQQQQQEEVVNYRVQQFGIIPPLVHHPTQAFMRSKYNNIQENIGSNINNSTTENLLAPPQLPQRESVDPLSFLNNSNFPNNPPPPPPPCL